MKRLFLVFSLITSSVFAQYNQQFQDEYSRFGFHRFEKGHPYYKKQSTSHPVINFPVKNSKVHYGFKETDKFTHFDSITRIALEQFIFDRLNWHRKREGVAELKWDERLRPATYHHVVYQRLVKDQTHEESVDLPNFTEYWYPWNRLKLLDQTVFEKMQECLLTTYIQLKDPVYTSRTMNPTFKEIVDCLFTPKHGLTTCTAHWDEMMSAEYNCYYMYADFDFKLSGDITRAVLYTETLGKYVD